MNKSLVGNVTKYHVTKAVDTEREIIALTLVKNCNLQIQDNFPGGSDGKESACSAGDLGSILGSGRAPGEGNGYPLQYSCLKIPWTEEPGRLQSMGSQRVRHG